jgi:hypothetical protein
MVLFVQLELCLILLSFHKYSNNFVLNCKSLGVCDYCLNKCICNKGFGAREDVFDARSKPADCAGRICPVGPSFTNFKPRVLTNSTNSLALYMDRFGQIGSESTEIDGRTESAVGGRVLAECSGVVRMLST